MSAHQGDSSPEVFVFPPFAPPLRHDAAPPAAAPAEATPVETVAAAEPEPFGFEVSVPAHDLGDPAEDDEMGTPEPEADGADLPWLELPVDAHTVHTSPEMPPPLPPLEADAPTWMAWETEASSLGETAAEITPPPLAAAGELTSVSAVPSPAAEPFGFDDLPDPAAAAEAAHPETMTPPEEPAHSWPVEAMEPAALQSAEAAPIVETPVAAGAAAVHAPAVDHEAFARVADRLEAIARSIRNDPGGFVSLHHDDPLALLVAGYALGFRQGSRAS